MPWLIGMSYKAVRTERYKFIHWVNKAGMAGVTDELYDLKTDPYEMTNLVKVKAQQPAIARLESMKATPQIDTLFKILQPLGYTLAVVPSEQVQK